MAARAEGRPDPTGAEPDRTQLAIYGTNVSRTSVGPRLFDYVLPRIGLPHHKYIALDCDSLQEGNNIWSRNVAAPTTLGTCISMPLKLQAMDLVDELTSEARAIGSCNTTYFRSSPSGSVVHVGTNLDAIAVENALLVTLTGVSSPFPERTPRAFEQGRAAAFILGAGGATRAAVFALDRMALSPILIVNRDPEEIRGVVEHFKHVDIRPLQTVEAARKAMEKLDRTSVKLVIGVGAIPPYDPMTGKERTVYEIARALFEHPFEAEVGPQSTEGYLPIPMQRVHLEMAYKPRMTSIRQIAEDCGWNTICGVEMVLEGSFEQIKLWTGRVVPREVREGGRRLLMEES